MNRSTAGIRKPARSSRLAGNREIRVGVVGVGRGQSFMNGATQKLGLKLVAICDTWEDKLQAVGRKFDVATYVDYDEFLTHDMDAVVLANYFHDHAPMAIKALHAGRHVMSETAACKTPAEGVALCQAVEDTGLVYMLAENYPYTLTCQEMRRVYQTGELGQALYADGEYNHPIDQTSAYWRSLAPTVNHWRNWIPCTYYCTHALAPLMYMTDTMPLSVNALAASWPEPNTISLRRSDPTSVILCRMDNGAIFRLFGLFTPGHSCWYRLHGTQGAMELERGHGYFGSGKVRVWHEDWNAPPGQVLERSYIPQWPEHAELASAAGHGGGDFWTNLHFARGIRGQQQVYLDVYRATAMSVVGPQAWRSALDNGSPIAIPDFKDKAARQKFADDHWSPFPEDAGPGQPPSSIQGFHQPSKALIKRYLKQVEQDRIPGSAAPRQ